MGLPGPARKPVNSEIISCFSIYYRPLSYKIEPVGKIVNGTRGTDTGPVCGHRHQHGFEACP